MKETINEVTGGNTMKAKLFGVIAAVLLLASVISASALNGLDMDSVEVTLNGRDLSEDKSTTFAMKKGDVLPVEVCFVPTKDVNLYFEVALVGGPYRELDVRETTGKKVHYVAGVKDCADTQFSINEKVDIGNYTLRVFSFDRTSASKESVVDYQIFVTGEQDELVFEKISMPASIMAGRSLNPKVFIRNNGRQDEERVDVSAELRSLVSGTVIARSNIVVVEDLNVNEGNKPSEELNLEIPSTLEAGAYEVRFLASYDRDFSEDTYSTTINVEKCLGLCAGKVISSPDTEITAGTTAKDVFRTGRVVFPLSIKNEGSRAVTYTIELNKAEEFAVYEVQPTNFFTVESGKAKDINLVLTPKAGADVGDHPFTVTIYANGEAADKLSFVATVVEAESAKSWTSVKNGLQIGFIVLLVLLVVLALIVIFSRFKGKEGEDEDIKGQTYY